MYLRNNTNVGALDSTGIVDRRRELGVAHPQHRLALGHVCLQEELQVIADNPFAHRVDVGQSVASSFEREETNQVNNLKIEINAYDKILQSCRLAKLFQETMVFI